MTRRSTTAAAVARTGSVLLCTVSSRAAWRELLGPPHCPSTEHPDTGYPRPESASRSSSQSDCRRERNRTYTRRMLGVDRRETERLLEVIREAHAAGEPAALATVVRVK